MNQEKTTEIEKPSMFELREWRQEHGFITPEWEAYAKASGELAAFGAAIGFAIGIIGIALGRV